MRERRVRDTCRARGRRVGRHIAASRCESCWMRSEVRRRRRDTNVVWDRVHGSRGCWCKGLGRATARAYRARRGRTRSHAGHSARNVRWEQRCSCSGPATHAVRHGAALRSEVRGQVARLVWAGARRVRAGRACGAAARRVRAGSACGAASRPVLRCGGASACGSGIALQCCFATSVVSPLMSRYGSRRLNVL
jgi:hypothetical protein